MSTAKKLESITLRDGSSAAVLRVTANDPQWLTHVEELLGHKPPTYLWANQRMLHESLGIDAYYYVTVVDGICVANIKTMEHRGVGILGDVYTRPEYRNRGVASQLMRALVHDFKARHGKTLYLVTGYDTPPYHLYAKFGFRSVEDQSGLMQYSTAPDFAEEYFAPAPATLRPVDWQHYPTSVALFSAPLPGVVRCFPLGLYGQSNSEGAFLDLLKRVESDSTACAGFGLQKENGALVGFGLWDCDPDWPDVARVDFYCHPNFWNYGAQLLDTVLQSVPNSKHALTAYCDQQCPQKSALLEQSGFSKIATLPRWVQDADERVDVHQYVLSKF